MRAVAIIPARYGSTRFPGKPLASQTGRPLIAHVLDRVAAADCFDRVLVATDDQRIADAVREFGGEAVMTRADHPSGTDRIAEVVRGLPADACDLVVNVQGDEPEGDPSDLTRLVRRLESDDRCPVATLACPFGPGSDPTDPNRVKLVLNSRSEAMYFSRSLIPYPREQAGRIADAGDNGAGWLLHLGVYAYRRDFLLEYAGWPPGRLEAVEKLEQLRILERGFPIAVEIIEHAVEGVDTPDDYARFVGRYAAASTQSRGR